MEYDFRLLGPLAVNAGGSTPDPLGSSKQEAILAVLLFHTGHPVSAGRLVDWVWEAEPPKQSTLHGHLSKIRSSLENWGLGTGKNLLVQRSGNYTLRLPARRVDWHLFREWVADGAEAARSGDDPQAMEVLSAALRLWQGEALSGFESRWMTATRQRMEEGFRQAAIHRAEVGLRLGLESELLGDLFDLAARFPEDELVAGHLMVALYRIGRGGEALDVCAELQRRLREEQGRDPGARITDLQRRILRHDPSLVGPVREETRISRRRTVGAAPQDPVPHGPLWEPVGGVCTLPRPVPDFIGREAESAKILASAEDDAKSQVWVIEGMAGMGKTALAVQTATRLSPAKPDAQIYVRLNAHTPEQVPRSANEALQLVLGDLGVSDNHIPGGTDALAALWRRRTASMRMVLVLDDAASAGQVRPLLPDGPGCVVLVTSRHRLAGLEGARHLALDRLSLEEAKRLFVRGAGEAAAGQEEQVAAVVRYCDRLPLAMRIAAARLRQRPSWKVEDLAALLHGSEEVAAEIHDGDSELTSIFATSLRGLSEDERSAFLRLGLHAGAEFTAVAAAALIGGSTASADRLLEALLRHNLVEEPAVGRFRFHDLIGSWARGEAYRLLSQSQRRQAVGRLADCYMHLADRADRLVYPYRRRLGTGVAYRPDTVPFTTAASARAWLGAEIDALLQVAQIARGYGLHRYESMIAHVLALFLESQGPWESAAKLHVRAVQVWAHAGEQRWHAQALLELSWIWHRTGRVEDAVEKLREALALAREIGDQALVADALRDTGAALRASARYAEALDVWQEAHAIYRALGDAVGEAEVAAHSARMRLIMGDHYKAEEGFARAVDLCNTVGNSSGAAKALNGLIGVRMYLGRHRGALEACWEMLSIFRGDGDGFGEMVALNNIGQVLNHRGEPDQALRIFSDSLKMCEDRGYYAYIPGVLGNMAQSFLLKSRPDLALEYYGRSLSAADSMGNMGESEYIEILIGLGDAHRMREEWDDAKQRYRTALDRALQHGLQVEQAIALDGLGEVLARTEGAEAAKAEWRKALLRYVDLDLPEADLIRAKLEAVGEGTESA